MKKWIAILLGFAMVVSLMGCTGKETTNVPDDPGKETTKAADVTTKADEATTPEETDALLPWYMWDSAHPERYGGTVKASYSDWSPTWDPMGQVSWTTHFWCHPVYQSLLIVGDDGKVYPQVCTYELNEEQTVIKLTIRDGMKFSDGTEVTTDDIIASLERAGKLIAATKEYFWDLLDHYEVDGKTITFTMKEYNAGTMRNVLADEHNSNNAVMKKAIVDKYGENLIMDPADTIGTGPYKFIPAECETEQKAVYERNEYYLPNLDNPEGLGFASPNYQYFDRVELMRLTADTTFMAVQGEELDAFSSTDVDSFNNVLAPLDNFKMVQMNSTGTYYCFFNCKEGSPMADANLRKAICAAFDYQEVAVTMYGSLAQLQDSILVKGVYPEYYEKDLYRKQDWYGGSKMDVAKKYLAESNYKGEVLKLTGYQDSFMPALKFLDELGIKYTWTKLDNATLRGYATDESLTDQWDMVYRPNPLATTPDGWTYTFSTPWSWGNDKVLGLLNDLKSTPYNTEKSFQIWDELVQEIINDCPWCIIMVQPSCVISKKTLELRNNNGWYVYHNGYWTDPENHQ